ncbi:uncharacterized protein LOC133832877 [Humulus lupulus]|uniref:uncharacterized protein LOC133832877 n=1 Tax=Humulus lupulus TaxID=3486 RepID=UPI002B4105D3|nr:uncharacterized protein LOC133832877 [Humulus lupulus]
MGRHKKTAHKPGPRSSPIVSSTVKNLHEGVEEKTKSWANEAEEKDFQELAKEKWSKFQDSFAAQGGAWLKYEEPLVREGKLIAQVDKEEIEVEASFWQSAMLGIERIARINAGHTLVKFRDEATRDMVLEAGVVHFDRKPVLLRPWSTDLDKMRLVKSVPVWIRLPDLGLQYWGLKSLSALVSTIGKPMMMDKVTKDKSMVKFVRVLVDEAVWKPKQKVTSTDKGEPRGSFDLCDPVNEARSKDSHQLVAGKDAQKAGRGEQLAVKGDLKAGKTTQTVAVKEASCSMTGQENQIEASKKSVFLETKLKSNKVEEMMKNVFFGWNWYSSLAVEGRILLVWKDDIVNVNVTQEMDQLINCEVKIKGVFQKVCLSFVMVETQWRRGKVFGLN